MKGIGFGKRDLKLTLTVIKLINIAKMLHDLTKSNSSLSSIKIHPVSLEQKNW